MSDSASRKVVANVLPFEPSINAKNIEPSSSGKALSFGEVLNPEEITSRPRFIWQRI
jgi:hypothetical protein